MDRVRGKFRCTSTTTFEQGVNYRRCRLEAVYDQSIPEDVRYAVATPVGQLELTVTNPDVTFEPGHSYYLDITPVVETTT